ncbi:MAG TPA: hypothetical protein VF671_11805 [Pseudomonas sp.]|uniref:hypothetical protein n=1 Tax=Pseudomonas sp. TaxID=306 RepID=UPI002ED90BE5
MASKGTQCTINAKALICGRAITKQGRPGGVQRPGVSEVRDIALRNASAPLFPAITAQKA